MRKSMLLATILISGLFSDSLLASRNNRNLGDDRDSPPPTVGKKLSTEVVFVATPGKRGKKNAAASPKPQQDKGIPPKIQMESEDATPQVLTEKKAVVDKLKQEAEVLVRLNLEAESTLRDAQSQLQEDQETLVAMLQQKSLGEKELEAAQLKKEKLQQEQSALKDIVAEETARIQELAAQKALIDKQIREGEALLAEQRMNGSNGPEDPQFQRMRAELEAEWTKRLEEQKALLQNAQAQSSDGKESNSNAPRDEVVGSQPAAGQNSNNDGKKNDATAGGAQPAVNENGKPAGGEGNKDQAGADTKTLSAVSPASNKPVEGEDSKKGTAAVAAATEDDDADLPPQSKKGYVRWFVDGVYEGAVMVKDTASAVGTYSSNLATNELSRIMRARDERFDKSVCPMITIADFLHEVNHVWFPGRDEAARNALMPQDFFCCLKPKWFTVERQEYNGKSGYFSFLAKVSAGPVRLVMKNKTTESKLATTNPNDQQNKKKADKFKGALLSADNENALKNFSGTFVEQLVSPIVYLNRIKALIPRGDLQLFMIDNNQCRHSGGGLHPHSMIVQTVFAFDEQSGESYHVTLWWFRVWEQMTEALIAEKYDLFKKDPKLGALLE